MNHKVLIIVNPVSGKNNIKKYIPRIKENFEKSDFQTEIKCNKPIELSIDGEYGGGKKNIRIHVKKQSVEYLVL